MEEFAASEKYRKYLVEIKIAGQTYYTVWGADMADEETDKLLLHDGKLIIISELEGIDNKIAPFAGVFKDAENVSQWLAEEKLETPYSDNDLDILLSYGEADVTDREKSIELLNTINLLQDFFYQIDEQNVPLFYQEVADLKDYIYDNYFWMDDEPEELFIFTGQLKTDLEEIYQLVITKYLHII